VKRQYTGSRSRSYTPKYKRRRMAPKFKRRGRKNYKQTKADNLVGYTQKLQRQGPYRRPAYQPIIKGTGHRAETQITWNSSVAGPAANPLSMIVNNYGAAYKVQSGTVVTQNSLTGFDAYFVSSQNAPSGYVKVFSKGVRVKILVTNANETAGKVRITFAKIRKQKNPSLPAQWNTDVNRPLATRHWKIIKSEAFIMEPADYTDAGAATGVTTQEKNYYIPINKWRYTITGDSATSGADWQLVSYSPFDAIYMFVDTNDANPTGSVIGFNCYINDYFSTVETNQT